MNLEDRFTTDYREVLKQVKRIDPVQYGKTRNFIDGAVTRLSPYISRGMISTRLIHQSLLKRGYQNPQMYKFVQELAWRDYWQQVWVAKGDAINGDLKRTQPGVENSEMPLAIVEGTTGIVAIDEAIRAFYRTGYIHNHVRMYIASLACNIGKSHWKIPARWMYFYLFDGDWASNALNWQWVAGSNSGKKYIANQENINRYCHTRQKGTYLDVDYPELLQMKVPDELRQTGTPELVTRLPDTPEPFIDPGMPTLVYTPCNLDPEWKAGEKANRVLLLEPSHFEQYPVSDPSLRFILDLSGNIPGIQPFCGEFAELAAIVNPGKIVYKEHPFSVHYSGVRENRDWMFDVTGYFPSFFAFWKRCEKGL